METAKGEPLCREFLEGNSGTNSKRIYITMKKLAKCYYDFTEFEDIKLAPKKIVSNDVESDDDDFSFAVIPETDYEHSSPVDVSEEHVDMKLIVEMFKEERARRLQKGNLIVALHCKDGVVFAVDHYSFAGADGIQASRMAFKNVFELRRGMVICITGDISACECLKKLLPPEGASLYCLENEEAIWRETPDGWFALGYCASPFARVGWKNIGAMAFEEAAKFARLVIRTAIAYYRSVERIYDGDDEKGYIGGPVSVYCVGSDGELVDKGEEPMPNIDLSFKPEPWFRMEYTPSSP